MNPETLKLSLHQALEPIAPFRECVLLDYPSYPNLGDHLIWLGALLYLTMVRQAEVKYTASIESFSPQEMARRGGKVPIFLNGGGNFGDLWPKYQRFREFMVGKYLDRPIVILPQTLYFRDSAQLEQCARIFNAHPHLTLCLRDNYSYAIAQTHFPNCQILKAPDLAFQLLNFPGVKLHQQPTKSILIHCRQDQELNQSNLYNFPDSHQADWVSFQWAMGSPSSPWRQILASLYREIWQRGLNTPQEWFARQQWLTNYPYPESLKTIYPAHFQSTSWSFLHSAIYQFQPYHFLITNRLHGHILAILLKIPHLFMPNAYYKNEGFYHTWTQGLDFCRFVTNEEEMKAALSTLILPL